LFIVVCFWIGSLMDWIGFFDLLMDVVPSADL
jgi:hypothetical protein